MLCWSDDSGNVECNRDCLDAFDSKLKREFIMMLNKEIILTQNIALLAATPYVHRAIYEHTAN